MIVARVSTVNGSCTIPGYDDPDDRWFIVETLSFGFDQGHVEKKKSKDGGVDLDVGQRNETTISISKAVDAASCDLMYQAMNDRFLAKGFAGEGVEDKGLKGSQPIRADIHFIETLSDAVVPVNQKQGKVPSGVIAYLRITLDTVKVKSWSISGDADGRPTESIELWCEQLAMRYQRTVDGRIYKDAGMQGWNQQPGQGGNRKWVPDKSTHPYFGEKYYPTW